MIGVATRLSTRSVSEKPEHAPRSPFQSLLDRVRFDTAFVFIAALTLYAWTLAPTVVWGDSAALALDARIGSVGLATAGDHPLFLLVGRVFAKLPGELARNVNLEAAVFGALAVMLVYRCGRVLGATTPAALTGAAALCVSHTFWQHAVVAEVYTANAFFLVSTMYLLLEWRARRRALWLAGALSVFAVGLMNHLVLATMTPAILAFILVTKGRELIARRLLIVLGAVATVVLALAIARPPALVTRLHHFWYGPPGIEDYLGFNFDAMAVAQEGKYYALYLVYQFPSIALALGGIGIWVVLRERPAIAVLLLTTIAANAFTFVRHTVWPSVGNAKYVFYISDYVVFSLLCAVGADALLARIAVRRTTSTQWALGILTCVALIPPVVYALAPWAVRIAHVDLLHARSLPYRDNNRYFLNPNKRGEYSARRFGEDALALAKPGAVIFTDYTPYTVLRYLKVTERRRPDVQLVAPPSVGGNVPVRWMYEGNRRRPAYLAALTYGYYDLSGLTGNYDLIPAGPMLEVCPR
jgi:hypothetical protein